VAGAVLVELGGERDHLGADTLVVPCGLLARRLSVAVVKRERRKKESMGRRVDVKMMKTANLFPRDIRTSRRADISQPCNRVPFPEHVHGAVRLIAMLHGITHAICVFHSGCTSWHTTDRTAIALHDTGEAI
jgi:hypothetical protein